MKIAKSQEVTKLLESRNIRDEEVSEVILEAEQKGGNRFYHQETGRYAAGKKIGEAVYWVTYTPGAESEYIVHSAYWHKSELS